MKLISIILICLLASCAVQEPAAKPFQVTSVREKDFTATNGRITAMFAKVSCDSVYVGKTITVSIGTK